MVLETVNLTKIYRTYNNRIEGIKNINLQLNLNEVKAVLGPNGSGKSTFIKMLCSEITPDSGSIYFFGESSLYSRNMHKLKKDVGYAPEIPFLYSKLTGREFSQFMSGIYGKDVDEGGSLSFNQIVSGFDLDVHMTKMISNYSQGTIRKLILAYAISFGEKLIILDEPSNGLDPTSYLYLLELLKECKRKNRAVLLSTHQLSMVEDISDNLVLFYNGEMKYNGKIPKDIKNFYLDNTKMK